MFSPQAAFDLMVNGALQTLGLLRAFFGDSMGAKGKQPVFIDAFAGCGGLSLGLMQAGMKGLFAIEKDEFAFSTLRHNLIDREGACRFVWPDWLGRNPCAIEDLLVEHHDDLVALRGKVDVLAGGPPCQGFSSAGRRRADDPRNRLFKSYVELVRLVEPQALTGHVVNVAGRAHHDPASVIKIEDFLDHGMEQLVHLLRKVNADVEMKLASCQPIRPTQVHI